MFRLIFAFLLCLGYSCRAAAHDKPLFDPTGYWTGAIVKDGSTLPISLTIEADGNDFAARTLFPDWFFYKPTSREKVEVTETGIIIRDLLSGDAVLELEPRFQQMTGTVGDDGRTVHIKRSVPPPQPWAVTTDMIFTSADGTRLAGSLTLPRYGEALGAMVMVRGRGCASRVNNRARFLSEYGMAVLTYDKRGAGKSEGDCATFTFDELTSDAVAAFEYLSAHPRVDANRVGFFGESAGAWTVQAATEQIASVQDGPRPAFIVTWIGPTTSILQQQISSAATYGESIGLSKDQQAKLAEATRIIVDGSLTDDDAYEKLSRIREEAEDEGWLDKGFGADDLPRQRTDMDMLWLRRFRYDPTPFLASLGDIPYLSILGAKDPIVPVQENALALKRASATAQVVVLPESGHGYDHDGQEADGIGGSSIWIFEGPDVSYAAETVRFLRENGTTQR